MKHVAPLFRSQSGVLYNVCQRRVVARFGLLTVDDHRDVLLLTHLTQEDDTQHHRQHLEGHGNREAALIPAMRLAVHCFESVDGSQVRRDMCKLWSQMIKLTILLVTPALFILSWRGYVIFVFAKMLFYPRSIFCYFCLYPFSYETFINNTCANV